MNNHPRWCEGEGPCGIHLSAPLLVTATGDTHTVPVEIRSAEVRDGTPAVSLAIYDSVTDRWVAAILRGEEADEAGAVARAVASQMAGDEGRRSPG